MPHDTRTITPDDIMDLGTYETIRVEKREEAILRKRFRRLSVGPHVTVTFENWDSMWLQVQEMLRIEKGGAEQLVDELAAYNPMIPNGSELTATLMFEIDDPRIRERILSGLGGVEDHIAITLGEDRIAAVPEGDVARTRSDGKASSVHFLHFPFTGDQVARWKAGEEQASFRIDHSNYGHIALIGPDVRRELARDFA
jgi:hypothetical protein